MKKLVFSAAALATLGFYACSDDGAAGTCLTCEIAETTAQVCAGENGHVWEEGEDTGLTPRQFIDAYCDNGTLQEPSGCVACAAYHANDMDFEEQEVCESPLGIAIVNDINVGIDYQEYIAALENFTDCQAAKK